MLVLFAVAACGGEAPSARNADRARATVAPHAWGPPATLADPRATIVSHFTAPRVRAGKLPNGIRTVYLERHDLPIVSITFALTRGRADDRATSLLLDALQMGSKARKPRFSAYLGWLGVRSFSWVERQISGITFETLSSHTTSVVLTAGEMLQSLSFDDEELDEARRVEAASIRAGALKVDAAAKQAAATTIGIQLRSDPNEILKLKDDEVEQAYKAAMAPDALIVSAVGDFTAAEMDHLLAQAFDGFKGSSRPLSRPAPVANSEKLIVLDRAKSEQSAIVIITPAPPITDPDSSAFRLASNVLWSRLAEARETKGYTYGVDVAYQAFDSYMTITLDVTTSRTGEALRDVLGGIESVRNAASASSLDTARSYTARYFTSVFNTNTDAGKSLARSMAFTGTPDVHYRTYDAMRDAKPAQVVAMAQKWMSDPHVVIVGDATAITADVSTTALGQPIVRPMP